jgi:hypothetical protein
MATAAALSFGKRPQISSDRKKGNRLNMSDFRDVNPDRHKFELQVEIRNILLDIRGSIQKSRFFLPIGKPDGSVSWVNLWQATEIHRISEDECNIKLADGQVIAVSTKEGVDAVIQAIREAIVIIEDLPTAPQRQAQTTLGTPVLTQPQH